MEWDADVCVYDSLIQGLQSRVNALSWSTGGTHLISSHDNDSVSTCFRELAKFGPWTSRPSFSRKHGAEQTRFIGPSTKLALALSVFGRERVTTARVWDMVQNRFLVEIELTSRVLRGNGISHHPNKHIFMANLIDYTVALHSTEFVKPIAVFQCATPTPQQQRTSLYRQFYPVSAFDAHTSTIAISADPTTIHLLDTRYLDQGPYLILPLAKYLAVGSTRGGWEWSWIRSLSFTPLNSNLLVTTSTGQMMLIDSSNGAKLKDYLSPLGQTLKAPVTHADAACPTSMAHFSCGFGFPAVSPNEEVVACGGLWGPESKTRKDPSGIVQLWNLRTGNLLQSFGQFADIPYFLAFNPVMAQLAVGDLCTTSWVLEPRSDTKDFATHNADSDVRGGGGRSARPTYPPQRLQAART